MKHTMIVGIPVEKNGKVVSYDDARQIATNELFGYRKRGYVAIPADYIEKAQASADKPDDGDLSKLKVPELMEIAAEMDLDIAGLKKAEIIEAIEIARTETEDE